MSIAARVGPFSRSYGPEENQRRFLRSANDGEGQALALRRGAFFAQEPLSLP